MANQTITTATFRAEEQGVDAVASKLDKLKGAAGGAARGVDEFARTSDTSAKRIGTVEREVDRLQRQLAGAPAAWAAYERGMRAATNGLDAGRLTVEQYGRSIQQLQQQLQRVVAPNLRMDVDATGLSSLLGSTQKVSAAQREAATQTLRNAQAQEAAIKAQADAQTQLAAAAAKLRAEIDPVAVAQGRLNAELDQYNALARAGAIDSSELAKGHALANARFKDATKNLTAANENLQLAGHQMSNLRSQGIDIATMYAGGASIGQIAATQSGQIFEAIAGQNGFKQGLKEIAGSARSAFGTVVSALGPVGIGLTAASVAAAGLWYTFREKVEPIGNIVEKQAESIRALRQAYGLAEEGADKYGRRSIEAIRASAEARVREGTKSQARSASDVLESFAPFDATGLSRRTAPALVDLKKAADAFRASVSAGNPDFFELHRALGAIQSSTADKAIIAFAKATQESIEANVTAQQTLAGTKRSLDSVAVAADRMAAAYGRAMGELTSMAPDARTEAERINAAFQAAADSARTMGQVQAAVAAANAAMKPITDAANDNLREERAKRAAIGLSEEAAAIAEVNARYEKLKESVAGNADAIAAYDAAQQEATAAVREQAKHDAGLKRAEDAKAYLKAVEDQRTATLDQVEAMRRQVDMFGQSEGAMASAEARTRMLADAYRLARENNQVVTPAQVAEIEAAAAEIGTLTDSLTKLRETQEQAKRVSTAFDDLAFERSILGLPEAEQRVREFVRSTGVDYTSANGQRLAEERRFNDALIETQDRLQETGEIGRDALRDIVDGFMSGENAIDSILGGLKNMAQAFARIGLEKLVGAFSGGSPSSGSGGGLLGALGTLTANAPRTAANQNAPAFGATRAIEQTYAAPIATVQRSVLPALTSFSGELNAAAKAIRTIESGSPAGNYSALGPITRTGDRAYGAYQMMGANIPQWSKEALGRVVSNVEFLGSKNIQDAVFKSRFGDRYATKYGMVGASQAWFAGEGGMRNLAAKDVVGTSVSGYSSKFASLFNKHLGSTNVASSTNDQKIVAKGVSQGLEDYQRKLGGPESYTSGRFDAGAPQSASGSTGGLMGLLKSPFGQGAMNALGAFGSGASGGPLSGALSGGLGAIGMGLGPVGIIAGIGAGVLGGLAKNLFNKKEREAAHRQQAAEWEQMLPQWREYQERMKSGAVPTSNLRKSFAADDQALSDFMRVGGKAWKYGSENSTALHYQVGLDRYAYQNRAKSAFRDSFETNEGGLLAGQGLEGPWAKARDAIRQASETLLTFVDDTSVAFGDAAAEVDRAKKAGVEQLRAALRGSEDLTEVQSNVLALEGAAAALRTELVKLGVASEDVARIVEEDLTFAMTKARSDFETGLRDQLDDLNGEGYLTQARDLIKTFDKSKEDAAKLGADTSLLPTIFAKQAQRIVDGSELAGDAFDALIKAFPQLSGVVKAFNGTARTAAELAQDARDAALASLDASKSQLQSVYQTILSYRDGLRSYQSQLKLSDSSTLSQADQVKEAQRVYGETLAKANAGDKEAMGNLTGAAGDLLSKAKDYFKTSPEYVAIFNSVSASLKAAEGKATSQLTTMEKQAAFLKTIADTSVNVEKALADLLKSQQAVNDTRNWGLNPQRNKAMVKAASAAGYDYTGAFGSGGWNAWISSMKPSDQAILRAIEQRYAGMNYDAGGYTGPGGRKEVAGLVHRGEVVWNQDDVARAGGAQKVDAMRLGLVRDPYPRTEMLRRTAANLNGQSGFASRGDMRDVTMRLDRIVDTLAEGFGGSIDATNRMSSAAEQAAFASRRAAIKSKKSA
ncbi:phage tail length tape measure family protein [Aureimonas sp. AU22]|uniref:phage tail length tape measure family protein n=1 Tax=Aureimonas sp. AU22 TaxID=1638162 RepID=UPI000782B607|nr:phage tail length tape measure family protein [Aureimonas sp. AU22]